MKTTELPLHIVKGEGAYLYTACGRRLIDAVSSWWVTLHGHSHPYMNAKISEQLGKLDHVMFTDFTHDPAVDLAEKLIAIAPGPMCKVFYTDNGSTANECALKMALQFWHNRQPATPRTKAICFNGGYHGDTFGAMSASGRTHYTRPFWNHLFEAVPIDPPFFGEEEASAQQMAAALKRGDAACFIFEPIVQGPAGMIIHNPQGLDKLLKLCKEEGVIAIADEVMTGFGRTGPLFACDILNEKPDMICLSKGITGGYLPLGATLCTHQVYDAFYSDDRSKTFLHGHTYAANPLICAAAAANLELLCEPYCTQERGRIANRHRTFAEKLGLHPMLKRCECIGTILVLEYRTMDDETYFSPICDVLKRFFLSRNIIVRPLGNVLYILPPYCISDDDLETIYAAILYTLENPLWKTP